MAGYVSVHLRKFKRGLTVNIIQKKPEQRSRLQIWVEPVNLGLFGKYQTEATKLKISTALKHSCKQRKKLL
jgi:hypothetical protein